MRVARQRVFPAPDNVKRTDGFQEAAGFPA